MSIVNTYICLMLLVFSDLLFATVISRFCKTEYYFYKTLGMQDVGIVKKVILNNKLLITSMVIAFAVTMLKGDFLLFIIKVIQFLMFLTNIIVIIYVMQYNLNVKKMVYCVSVSVKVTLICYIIVKVLLCIEDGYDAKRALGVISEDALLKSIYDVFCVKYNWIVVMLSILLVIFLCLLKRCDNKIIETTVKKNKHSNVYSLMDNIHIFGGIKSVCRGVLLTIRKTTNLIMYLSMYIILVVLICNIQSLKMCNIATYLIVIMINACVEGVYREDSPTKYLYRIMGEDYNQFLIKKLKVTAALNIVPLLIYMMSILYNGYNFINIFYYLISVLFMAVYWNVFYASWYFKMWLYADAKEYVWLFIGLLLFLIPVVNCIVAYLCYKTGKKRWEDYVNS